MDQAYGVQLALQSLANPGGGTEFVNTWKACNKSWTNLEAA